MTPLILACLCAAVFVGAISQRIVGLGYPLLAAPILVLALDPENGVLIVNITGGLLALLVAVRVWREVDWPAYAWLAIPAIPGAIIGTLAALRINADVAKIVTGVIVVIALGLSVLLARTHLRVRGRTSMVVTGFATGALNAGVGVGAPAITAFGVLSGWSQQKFFATLQPFLFTVSLASVVTRLALRTAADPPLQLWLALVLIVPLLLGLFAGDRIAPHVSAKRARVGLILFAFAGGLAAIVAGVLGLVLV